MSCYEFYAWGYVNAENSAEAWHKAQTAIMPLNIKVSSVDIEPIEGEYTTIPEFTKGTD